MRTSAGKQMPRINRHWWGNEDIKRVYRVYEMQVREKIQGRPKHRWNDTDRKDLEVCGLSKKIFSIGPDRTILWHLVFNWQLLPVQSMVAIKLGRGNSSSKCYTHFMRADEEC